jgi:molybdenum cofactor cytidylyltransferase
MGQQREEIVPVILAAGSSRHLGFPKPLAEFGGTTALQIAIENCAGLRRPIVVLGCDGARVRPRVPQTARVVVNTHWRSGQLSSLLCALEHIDPLAAVMIYPVDLPLLKKHTIRQLVRGFRERSSPQEIVMPRHKGVYGHPIILSASLRGELLGAKTAREVVYRDPKRICVFEARTAAIYEDFDTPHSYRKCLRKFETNS